MDTLDTAIEVKYNMYFEVLRSLLSGTRFDTHRDPTETPTIKQQLSRAFSRGGVVQPARHANQFIACHAGGRGFNSHRANQPSWHVAQW
jgi:hypothetical protein